MEEKGLSTNPKGRRQSLLAYLNCLSLVMRVSNKWRNSFRSFRGCLFDKWVMLWQLFVFGDGFVDLHNIRFQVLKDGLVGLETSTRSPEIISISTSPTVSKKKKKKIPIIWKLFNFIIYLNRGTSILGRIQTQVIMIQTNVYWG